ncbi:MAG TPA: hypothetical protein VFT59_02015 [Candidatus Saccharimonadales bacterium]|nr:hypothetical protein [Candidatus Saccharimonadales bacterium]
MQPEQNQPIQPTTPTPGSATPKPKGPPMWLWFVIAGIVILLIAGVWLLVSLLMPNRENNQQTGTDGQVGQLSELKVGLRPYVYPCAVATEADYARIFGLDETSVGTVSETSALAAEDIRAETSDLTKIAPAPSDTYDTSCSYTLTKKGATRVNRIEVQLTQSTDEKEVQEDFKSKRSLDSGDITFDGVDNGTKPLGTLPSFPETSYVILPEAGEAISGLKAIFISETYMITLQYNFVNDDTTDNTLPRFDEYAKAIQTKLNEYKQAKPVDLTGRETFVGKKFVDVCQRTDLMKLAADLGDIQFRPDEARYSSTYGSLAGSRAAQDGAVSSCDLGFNTPGDRQAQGAVPQEEKNSELDSSSRLTSDEPSSDGKWPHNLSLTVNSYRTPEEAKAALTAKKQRASNPTPNGVTPTVEDVTGIGEGAYKYHRESTQDTMFNGQDAQIVTIDDILVVASGSDVITVGVTQSSENIDYQTVPVEVTETALKKVFEQIKNTLAANR